MRIMILCRVTAIILSCALYASQAIAKTWHVPGDAATIQGGINLASANDTVLVACGIYYEYDIRMKSGVCLRSETGDASCVTIDAQQQDRVIYCRFVSNTAHIEGFTITGGFAENSFPLVYGNGGGLCCLDNSSPTVENCTITGDSADWNGGGVYCGVNSSPTFINCTITGNSAPNGGSGMCFQENSDATMTDCTISDNFGDGIWVSSSSIFLQVTNCVFSGNSKSGIKCSSGSSVILTDCNFSDNSGGGAVAYGSSSPTFTNCTFSNNSSVRGGGMSITSNAIATLTSCAFTGNSAINDGGGIMLEDASATLVDCSFTNNSAKNGGGVYLEGTSTLTADTTEFYNNTVSNEGARGFIGSGSEAILTCCVADLSGFAGDGTITLNNEGCFSPTEPTTWGRLKALYR
ncbi:MAG: right-handed parallel beta-helix repeat-containing protein [Candidatus Latescibacterota bacterium]|nr:MAG: right-handed parallel beta-helix repeat-containing protein [Candidatus Latescibacterota bacterium]